MGDVTSLVGHAMSIYNAVSSHNKQGGGNQNSNSVELHPTNSEVDSILKDSKKLQEHIELEKTNESNRRKDATLLINEQLSNKFNTDKQTE